VPTLFTATKFQFIFTVALFFMTPFSSAVETSKYKEAVFQNIEYPSQAVSLPAWVYKELVSIQKEVSVIDANGATKESVQALKERLGKVEVQLEQSQLRVDDALRKTKVNVLKICKFILNTR